MVSGGLGHIGVQISRALGAHTTVLELTDDRRADAERLGADSYRTTREPGALASLRDTFDLIVSTVPVSYDVSAHLDLLDLDGTLVNLGVPDEPLQIDPYTLLTNRRTLAGSMSGGMPQTQEMLDFCAEHGVRAEVEVVAADKLDRVYDRLGRRRPLPLRARRGHHREDLTGGSVPRVDDQQALRYSVSNPTRSRPRS